MRLAPKRVQLRLLSATALCALFACGEDAADPTDSGNTSDVGSADTTGDTTPAATCGTDSPTSLAACVEQSRYAADLELVARERATGTPGAAEVREHAVAAFTALGLSVEVDEAIGQGANIIATLNGTASPDELVVISAHYDSTPLCTGADDNATGVAGVLEAARVLSQTEHERTIVFALWDEEERGMTGSWHWTDAIAKANTKMVVHVVFEMIGYATDAPNTQELPLGFDLLFPEIGQQIAENDNRGDFIALISNGGAAPFAERFAEHAGPVTASSMRACDPVSNAPCASGDKCALVYQSGGFYGLQCIPLAAAPVGAGELCTRPEGTVGDDTCEIGHFCAFWGMPASDPQDRQCLPTCAASAECGEGSACRTFANSLPRHGACVGKCDPFQADACGEGLHCTGERPDSEGRLMWSCNRFGSATRGETCRPGFDECASELACGYSLETGIARCGAPCDDAHPCPEGETCHSQSNASLEHPNAGVCHSANG